MSIPNDQQSEAQAEEQTTAPAAEQTDETAEASEATEAKEGEDLDAKDSEEDQTEEEREKPKATQKGAAKKIGKLTRKLSEKDREIEYLRAQLFKDAPKQAEPIDQAKTKAEGKPNPNDFEDHASYVEALTDWKIEQRDRAREAKSKEESLKSDFQKKQESYHAKAQAFAKEHPDFEDVISEADDVRLSITVQDAILRHGPELAYELAKDVETLESICSMSALEAAEAIGEIRARIKGANSKAKPELKLTKAPKPPTPINSKSASVKKSIYDPDISQKDFERLREEQEARRAR